MKGRNTHEHTDTTWQHISAPTERALSTTHKKPDAQHRNEEQKEKESEQDAATELETIQARLRFINMMMQMIRGR